MSKRQPIRPRSKRMAKTKKALWVTAFPEQRKTGNRRAGQRRQYLKAKKRFLKEHPYCVVPFEGCTIKSTDCHHVRGRAGKLYLDERFWLPVCRVCHDWMHFQDPEEASQLGLLGPWGKQP